MCYQSLYHSKQSEYDNKEKLLPVVDEEGRVIRSMTRGEAHGGSKILHPVVHLHVFNSKGELYLHGRMYNPANGILQWEVILDSARMWTQP